MTEGTPQRAVPDALGPGLAGLKAWRGECAAALADLRRWALVSRLCDQNAAARLAHLERRLATGRLGVAFVAEHPLPGPELINALFHCDPGTPLFPAAMASPAPCPTQILHDASRAPSISALPIETRESPRSLREFIADAADWTQIAIDPADPGGYAQAFEVLAETIGVSAALARRLGFPAEQEARVEIPRWRYAIVNHPHPLLALGLEILLAPGVEALANEPDLTLHRLPEADAIVFVLSADGGSANPDLRLWRDYVRPVAQMAGNGYVILDCVAASRDGAGCDTPAAAPLDAEARHVATTLGMDAGRVFPVFAGKAAAARLEGDGNAFAESGLARLEEALAREVVHARRLDHVVSVRAESRLFLAEARALLESRRQFAQEQASELGELRRRSTLLLQTLATRAAEEEARADEARTVIAGLHAVHGRHADSLAALLDPGSVREAGMRARARMLESPLSGGISESVDGFLAECRSRLGRAVQDIGEVNAMIAAASKTFEERWGLAPADMPPFATDRFVAELDRIEEQSRRDLQGTRSLLTRRRESLAALFLDSVAVKAVKIFEICDREVRAWMNAFIRPLHARVAALQEQASHRLVGAARMRDAQASLVDRIGSLDALARECAEQRREWEAHESRLASLLEANSAGLAPGSSPAPWPRP